MYLLILLLTHASTLSPLNFKCFLFSSVTAQDYDFALNPVLQDFPFFYVWHSYPLWQIIHACFYSFYFT